MKLAKGVTVHVNGKKFVGEIPDELAKVAGLSATKPKPDTGKTNK